jgi:hypothetical protein
MKNWFALVMISFALAISPALSAEEDKKLVGMTQQAVTPPPRSSSGGRQDPLTDFVFGVKMDVPEQKGYFQSAEGLSTETETTDRSKGELSETKPLFAAPAHKIQVDQPALDLLKTKFEGPNLMVEEVRPAGQVTEVKVLGYDETKTKGIMGGEAPGLLEPRAEADEAGAIGSLKTLVSNEAMYYQGDLEEEGAAATKYTMFMPDGMPVRATVNLKMTETKQMTGKSETKRPPPEDLSEADSDNNEDEDAASK